VTAVGFWPRWTPRPRHTLVTDRLAGVTHALKIDARIHGAVRRLHVYHELRACRCRILHPSWLRDQSVLVDHAAEDLAPPQTRRVWFDCRIRPSSQAQRGLLLQATVRPMPVVVEDVLGQDLLEMAATEDEKPVQALAACGANKALRDRIRSRGSHRSLHYPDAVGAEHVVEADGELRGGCPELRGTSVAAR